MREYQATILENKPAAENIYSLILALPEAVKIRAGQFADLSVGGAHLLKRPLAVCKADGEKVTVCYQIRGEGTKLLSERKAGETLDALLPLGNGFYLKENGFAGGRTPRRRAFLRAAAHASGAENGARGQGYSLLCFFGGTHGVRDRRLPRLRVREDERRTRPRL